MQLLGLELSKYWCSACTAGSMRPCYLPQTAMYVLANHDTEHNMRINKTTRHA